MKQFYKQYKDYTNLSTLLREISWPHNLDIFPDVKKRMKIQVLGITLCKDINSEVVEYLSQSLSPLLWLNLECT